MITPKIQRMQSAKDKKLQDRLAKLAEDKRRINSTAIRDTDLNKWIAALVS
jgi:hypothetical protein